MPIVLMEAMALGTAVIASRVAGIPELVEEDKTGLLFTPSKWDELAACMLRLLGDDELRKTLAQKAKTAVATEFDIKSSANQLACALQRKLRQVTIFPGFDRIRIINLPSRPDRRAEMLRELRRIGLGDDPRVQFVDGILVEDKAPWRAPGEKGVFLAQLGIIT